MNALLRPCSWPGGCSTLTPGGRCPTHAGLADKARGTATIRGYGRDWRRFRLWTARRLVALGIAPVCGAAHMKETEAERLERRGFDGLFHPDPAVSCGCFLRDLRPCGETKTGCRGGLAYGDGIYSRRTVRLMKEGYADV